MAAWPPDPYSLLLFPIQHGILYYPGFDVLPPFLVYKTSKVDQAAYPLLTEALGRRLDALATAAPIAYRGQNAGDYEIPAMTLREGFAPGAQGFGVHVRADG